MIVLPRFCGTLKKEHMAPLGKPVTTFYLAEHRCVYLQIGGSFRSTNNSFRSTSSYFRSSFRTTLTSFRSGFRSFGYSFRSNISTTS